MVVAGSLKRSDRERPEDQVLMRALRDFNIPKIVTDDVPIFMGLIGDLFPALDVPRKRDMDFEALVKRSALVRHEILTLNSLLRLSVTCKLCSISVAFFAAINHLSDGSNKRNRLLYFEPQSSRVIIERCSNVQENAA